MHVWECHDNTPLLSLTTNESPTTECSEGACNYRQNTWYYTEVFKICFVASGNKHKYCTKEPQTSMEQSHNFKSKSY